MGSSSENRCMLFKSSTGCFRVGVGIGIGIDLATLVDGPTLLPGRYLPRYRPRNCWLNVTHFHHPVVTARRHSRHLRKSPFKRGWRPFSGAGGCQACRWDIPLALSRRPPFQGGINFHHLVVLVGLARLWIPAFAGMTMKAKAAVMGSSQESTGRIGPV
jgi:hypothetical protein